MLTIGLPLLAAVVIHGCVAVAATTMLSHSHTDRTDAATVQLAKGADDVYAAEVRVLENRSDMKIVKRDPDNHVVEAVRGRDRIRVDADPLEGGMTALVVTAKADGRWKDNEELALDIEKQICDELGVKYAVVEMAGK
jgi:hypothetical protein